MSPKSHEMIGPKRPETIGKPLVVPAGTKCPYQKGARIYLAPNPTVGIIRDDRKVPYSITSPPPRMLSPIPKGVPKSSISIGV